MAEDYGPGAMVTGKSANYRVERRLTDGNFASSYKAQRTDGTDVFLKQYVDPSTIDGEYYQAFVAHQDAMFRALDGLTCVERCYETFEFHAAYHQAKEFMAGQDLRALTRELKGPEERLLVATVAAFGLREIHDRKVIHTDLKPEQIYLEHADTRLKYRVRYVDFDFGQVLTTPPSRPGDMIVSTIGYASPEHVTGAPLTFASDVFTFGIILGELLGGASPLAVPGGHAMTQRGFGAAYAKVVNDHKLDRNVLNVITKHHAAPLAAMIERVLQPAATDRPTAAELHEFLLQGLRGSWPSVRPVAPPVAAPGAAAPTVPAEAPPVPAPPAPAGLLELQADGLRYPYRYHQKTAFGRDQARILGPVYKGFDAVQFEVLPSDGGWEIVQPGPTTNPVRVNGEVLSVGVPRRLALDDVIEIGPAKLKVSGL